MTPSTPSLEEAKRNTRSESGQGWSTPRKLGVGALGTFFVAAIASGSWSMGAHHERRAQWADDFQQAYQQASTEAPTQGIRQQDSLRYVANLRVQQQVVEPLKQIRQQLDRAEQEYSYNEEMELSTAFTRALAELNLAHGDMNIEEHDLPETTFGQKQLQRYRQQILHIQQLINELEPLLEQWAGRDPEAVIDAPDRESLMDLRWRVNSIEGRLPLPGRMPREPGDNTPTR